MGKINIARWILGGIIGGIVGDIVAFLSDGVWLAPLWTRDMHLLGRNALGSSQFLLFNLIGLVTGLVTIWIYAAIRPRFGPGVKTAIYAGLAVWMVGFLLPNTSFMYVTHLFSRHLTLYTTIGDLVAVLLGTIAGAALYKEDAAVAAESRQVARA